MSGFREAFAGFPKMIKSPFFACVIELIPSSPRYNFMWCVYLSFSCLPSPCEVLWSSNTKSVSFWRLPYKRPQMVASNMRNWFSHSSGGQKSEISKSARGWFPLKVLEKDLSLPLSDSGGSSIPHKLAYDVWCQKVSASLPRHFLTFVCVCVCVCACYSCRGGIWLYWQRFITEITLIMEVLAGNQLGSVPTAAI